MKLQQLLEVVIHALTSTPQLSVVSATFMKTSSKVIIVCVLCLLILIRYWHQRGEKWSIALSWESVGA